MRREVAIKIKRLYELSLVRTLKPSLCEHNLARTHYWKYAAQSRCALHIWAQTGWLSPDRLSPQGKRDRHARELQECSGTFQWRP